MFRCVRCWGSVDRVLMVFKVYKLEFVFYFLNIYLLVYLLLDRVVVISIILSMNFFVNSICVMINIWFGYFVFYFGIVM